MTTVRGEGTGQPRITAALAHECKAAEPALRPLAASPLARGAKAVTFAKMQSRLEAGFALPRRDT